MLGWGKCQAGNATKLEESQTTVQSQCQEGQQSTAAMPGGLILNYRDARMPTDQLL